MCSFRGDLPAPRLAQSLDVAQGLADRRFEVGKIDRLCQKIKRPAVHRGANIGQVAIAGEHEFDLAVPNLAPKLLLNEGLKVRLVIDHEDGRSHAPPPLPDLSPAAVVVSNASDNRSMMVNDITTPSRV